MDNCWNGTMSDTPFSSPYHGIKMGLRKSRYEGTNRGTKGTVVNQTLLLLPRFPYKNIIIARYLDFRIEKKYGKSRYKLRWVQTCSFSPKYLFCKNRKNRKYNKLSGGRRDLAYLLQFGYLQEITNLSPPNFLITWTFDWVVTNLSLLNFPIAWTSVMMLAGNSKSLTLFSGSRQNFIEI